MSLQRVAFQPLHTFTRATDEAFWNRVVDAFGNVSYELQTAPAGTAVQNAYDPSTGEPLGLQIFEQRANLLRYSEQFDNVSWANFSVGVGVQPVVTANAGIAPSGEMTADRVDFDCGDSSSIANRSLLSQPITTVTGTTYSAFIYVKAFASGDIGKTIAIRPENIGLTQAIVTLSDAWQKIQFTGTATGTAINYVIECRGTLTGQTASVLLWGAQIEAGSFPTPYIKTEADTATRNASVAVINDIDESEWWNPNEGTFVVEWVQNSESGRVFSIQSSVTKRIGIMPSNTFVSAIWFNDGSPNYANSGVTAASIVGQKTKAALSFATGKIAISVNGQTTASTVTANPTPPFVDTLSIGSHAPAIAGNYINGHVFKIIYIPTAVSDAKLQELSAL